jgi:hypothetical protein
MLTTKLIEEYGPKPWAMRELSCWLDHLWDTTSQATQDWNEQGNLGEKHPIEQLIDALYHDLCAKGYWAEQSSREEWEQRARDLGFKTEGELKAEAFEAEMKKRRAKKEADEDTE